MIDPMTISHAQCKGNGVIPFMQPVTIVGGYNNFLLVVETLKRIGLVKGKTLTQQVHIKFYGGLTYLGHYNHMHMFDTGENLVTERNVRHMNRVAQMLQSWGLVNLDPDAIIEPSLGVMALNAEKAKDYTLVSNYTFKKNV